MMRAALALSVLLTASCTSVQLPADSRANFDPIAFFTGRSQGEGSLHQLFSSPQQLRVESEGRPDGRGGLVLTQRIRQDGKAPRTRQWVMRRVGPNRYTGTLTEAVGPVSIMTSGPRATIRYTMKDGLQVRQQLALQGDGRTLLNHLTVTKWGVRVARVEETIRKLP